MPLIDLTTEDDGRAQRWRRSGPRPFVLDTDIGSDVDDALALAVLLGSPEVELLGVSTVYGDVGLRARIAARLAGLAGRQLVCAPGLAQPMSGRAVWMSGREGALLPGVDRDRLEPAGIGPAWLVEQARAHPGALEVAAVGPLTNLAAALELEPGLPGLLRGVWVMGGRFGVSAVGAGPEHNLACDAVAADRVLGSELPVTVVGLEITRQVTLRPADVDLVEGWGPLGRQLAREVRDWTELVGGPQDVPHDATCVLRALEPLLFQGRRARLRVTASGAEQGCVREEDGPPRTEVATAVDAGAAREEILQRIGTACGAFSGAPTDR